MRLVLLFWSFVLPVLACDCRRLPACQLLEDSRAVFIGDVIAGGISSLLQDPWQANITHVRFKVVESFRGLPSGAREADLEISPPFGMCSAIPYFRGKRYLVFATMQNGKLHDGNCFQGRELDTAAEELEQVRNYFSSQPRAIVYGGSGMKAGEAVDADLPLVGVRVSTIRGGTTYSTTTGTDGRYKLQLPSGGAYQLRAESAPYGAVTRDVSVPQRGCAKLNFGFEVGTAISGKVVDEQGRAVKRAAVGLVRADRPVSIVAYAHIDKPDGAYKFSNIPLGRYLIVFNPDGPAPDGVGYSIPFEKTTRAVEITSPGMHLTGMDLTVGKPVSFRQVTVRVQFSNGRAMSTASVECVGTTPLQPAEVWSQGRWVNGRTGLARFSAPANRGLEIRVRDQYDRPLKRSYSAKRGAGTSPIDLTFVVTP